MATDSRSGRSGPRNEILINVTAGETRVAILEQGQFTELYIERERERSVTGMVALGRVTRVLPGMQAAFVDIGLEKAAFLYVGDYLDEADALAELDAEEEPPRQRRRRNGRNGRGGRPQPRIDTLLREGQEITVQVAKDPIGTKGARITSHVSIAGRMRWPASGPRIWASSSAPPEREPARKTWRRTSATSRRCGTTSRSAPRGSGRRPRSTPSSPCA